MSESNTDLLNDSDLRDEFIHCKDIGCLNYSHS